MPAATEVRPPAVAGLFYSAEPQGLAREIYGYLEEARAAAVDAGALSKALIVPHAGYVYSAPIAARAYAGLAARRGQVRRVVLLGPTHRVPIKGVALPTARAFQTPLGAVPVDREAATLRDLPQVHASDAVHALEHSIEVQLPFLQTVLGEFELVPLAVGDATPREVEQVLERLWGGPETLVVVSSDLSHYHTYADARRIDEDTVQHILALAPILDYAQACGAMPINGLLLCARGKGVCPTLLDLRNSGDTAGDKARVVGYAAFSFA